MPLSSRAAVRAAVTLSGSVAAVPSRSASGTTDVRASDLASASAVSAGFSCAVLIVGGALVVALLVFVGVTCPLLHSSW